ncbi:MAG: PfkB family carbohydrate kinase [Spirochaetes bacterium]|nr:PfkB family carbohydrate kinase [Spirochaetota bacterium]
MPTLIAVIGGLNLDIQASCSLPFVPRDSNPGRADSVPGGVGRNIAENLVRLGNPVELVSVAGSDPDSDRLVEACTAAGIGTSGIRRLAGESCSRYLCLLDSDGTLVGAVAAMSIFDRFGPEVVDAAEAMLDAAAFLVVDANPCRETIERLATRWGGKPILFDPVSAAKAGKAGFALGRFAMIKPNRAEATALTGVATDTDDGIRKAASALRVKGVREVYLSLGSRGIYWDDGRESGLASPPADAPPAVNVSGSGDAAAAALAWASLSGAGPRDRAACALAAAMLTAGARTAVSPYIDPETIMKLLKGVIHAPLS